MDLDGKGGLSAEDVGRIADLPEGTARELAAQYELRCLEALESASDIRADGHDGQDGQGDGHGRQGGEGSVATRQSAAVSRSTRYARGRSVRSARHFLDEARQRTRSGRAAPRHHPRTLTIGRLSCPLISTEPCLAFSSLAACAQSEEAQHAHAHSETPAGEFAASDWEDAKQDNLGARA